MVNRGSFHSLIRGDKTEAQEAAFEEAIRTIPRGMVATYGQVAEAAGYPRYHRAVARFLASMHYYDIPWQRVVGAGGAIKLQGSEATKQRSLLEAEGVSFKGKRIDMQKHGYYFDL